MNPVIELCEGLPTNAYRPGEYVISQGETKNRIVVLKKGTVEVVKDNQVIAVVDQPGAVFGEMGVILGAASNATVRVAKPSEFFMIRDPQSFFWERSEFLFELLKILARRLEQVDQKLADWKKALPSELQHGEAEEALEKALHRPEA